MFTYKKDLERSEFIYDGDLTQDLIKIGVPGDHIQAMKTTLLKDRFCYDVFREKENRETRLVPLCNVVGFSRGDVGKSVFDNVERMAEGDREYTRFQNCFAYFDWSEGLKGLYLSYEKLIFPVMMLHDIISDEYYVSSDGNHRTLIAKLVGAPYILARVTDVVRNFEEERRRDKCKELYSRYGIRRIYKSVRMNGEGHAILFERDGKSFLVYGYSEELSISDIDQRMAFFEQAIARDITEADRLRDKNKLFQMFLLLIRNRQVRQFLRQEERPEGCPITYPEYYMY